MPHPRGTQGRRGQCLRGSGTQRLPVGRSHVEEGHFSVSTHLISWPLVEIEFTFNFDQVSGGKEEGRFILPHCSGRGVAAVLGLQGDPRYLDLECPGLNRVSLSPAHGALPVPTGRGWLPPPLPGLACAPSPGGRPRGPPTCSSRSLRAGAGTAVLSGSLERGRELSHRSCWGARETLLFCVLKDERDVPQHFSLKKFKHSKVRRT